MRTEPLKKVAVIGTGGTISTLSSLGALDFADYMINGKTLDVTDFLQRVPEAGRFAELIPVPFRAVSSTAMDFAVWKELVAVINQTVNDLPDLAGIVILHGTATLEETAYILQLTLKTRLPVVLVGAQRPLNALSSDGPLNFVNAVRVAIDIQSTGMGILVCLNNEIQAAREVTKSSTSQLQTFQTPDFGILGLVDNDGIAFFRRPLRLPDADAPFDIDHISEFPRVDIAYSYAGDDGTVIDALAAAKARGIVIAAFPGGRLSRGQKLACERALEQGIAVALSTRAGSGRAIVDSSLTDMGCIPADNLNPQKARILLTLALTQSADRGEVTRLFGLL